MVRESHDSFPVNTSNNEDDTANDSILELEDLEGEEQKELRLGTGFDAEVRRLNSHDEIIRQMAMHNLMEMARQGGGEMDRIVDLMITKLRDDDKVFRGQAVEALEGSGHLSQANVIDALVATANDNDARVRCLTVNALRQPCMRANAQSTAKMVELLNDPSRAVREGAEENILLSIPQAQHDFREKLLENPNAKIRASAVRSFGKEVCGSNLAALHLVVAKLKDPELHVRMAAVDVLGAAAPQKDASERQVTALIPSLSDSHIDIRRAGIARLSFEASRKNAKVVKAVALSLYDEDPGFRKLACDWLTIAIREALLQADESGFNLLLETLENGTGVGQLAAAQVLGEIVGNGNKYLKLVAPLMRHEDVTTRIAAVRAMAPAVMNKETQILWTSSGAPIVPACLTDSDKRVRMETINVLAVAPPGTAEALAPLVKCLEDDEQDIRNHAADVLASSLGRQDKEIKHSIAKLVDQCDPTLAQLGAGCEIGPKYRSLEVGYAGRRERHEFQVRAAAIRSLRKMGISQEIIQRGSYAIETAIDRYALGFKYELPPNFFDAPRAIAEQLHRNRS